MAEFVGSRDIEQVRYRINYLGNTRPKSRRRAERLAHIRWSEKEENRFEEGVKLFGKNWQQIAEHVGTRDPKQIYAHF